MPIPVGDHRLDQVFRCIIEQYIDTAEPVGSRLVSKIYDGKLSPATIRNVMADLEDLGLIAQPHTSAGRVPTEKGYRYYVDTLMAKEPRRRGRELPGLKEALRQTRDLEEMAEKVSHLLAELTHNAALLLMKNVRRVSYFVDRHPDWDDDASEREVSGNRLYVDGASLMFEQPEFRDAIRIAAILKTFEIKRTLSEIMERHMAERCLRIHIGAETGCSDLEGMSVVAKEYLIEDKPVGCLGVIGPMRMHYDRTALIVDEMADAITEFLSG